MLGYISNKLWNTQIVSCTFTRNAAKLKLLRKMTDNKKGGMFIAHGIERDDNRIIQEISH